MSSKGLVVPVRVTNVKEEHLRGKVGVVLMDHQFTNMTTSFMVDIGSENGLLQCGSYEIEVLTPDDPQWDEAMEKAE